MPTAVVISTVSTPLTSKSHKLTLEPACRDTMDVQHSPPSNHVPHVYRLPVETLARIFETGTNGTGDINDATEFPMIVAAVSRRFRSVAIQTPNLWTTIKFESERPSWYDVNANNEYDYSYDRDLLWINRSKACPLNFILDFCDEEWNYNESKHYFRREHMEAILALIHPHAARIRRFTLLCDTFPPIHAALIFLAQHGSVMESIQTLELYRCNEYPAEHPVFTPRQLADPIPLLGGSRAPNLASVVLSGVHVDWTRSQTPLSNLKSLVLSFHPRNVRPSASEFTQLLYSSPHLTSLTVSASGPFPSINLQNHACPLSLGCSSRIRFPMLQNLEIGYQRAVDAVELLHLIDAPSVISLTIQDTLRTQEGDNDGGNFVLETLLLPSFKNFTRLENLCFRGIKASTRAFSLFLELQNAVHTLNLVNVSKEALYVIASRSSSSPDNLPCPALKHLSLASVSAVEIGSIARARAVAGLPLDDIFVDVMEDIDDEELAVAKQCCEMVNIVRHEEDPAFDEDYDPYAPGGAFNDPEFDSMFT